MVQQFTAEQVSQHNQEDDCWIIVNSRVYDVTDFLPAHPAGKQIIRLYAGKDATEGFLDVHSEKYILNFAPGSFRGIISGSNATAPPGAGGRVRRLHDENSVLAVKRTLYGPEHEAFRARWRAFLKKEVVPMYPKWERKKRVDASVYHKAAKAGFYVTVNLNKKWGGCAQGITDWRYNAILAEEVEYLDVGGLFFNLGTDMCMSYYTHHMSPEQQQRWLPHIAQGEKILAVAMSEPEVGSDLGALGTTAIKSQDGSHYLVNGRKFWISSGSIADYIVVAVRTDPKAGAKGISLLVLEKGMPGFKSAKRVGKIGKMCQDTCLLTMKNVKVPVENLIGSEGKGFTYLMTGLPKERLSIAVGSIAAARRALALTVNYVQGREAFGGTLGGLSAVQQTIAKLRTEVDVTTAFIDRCIADVSENKLSTEAASMAKAHATEVANHVANECLQLYGGYGYLKGNPVARLYMDQRVTKIYGGANEVMMEITAKGLGFRPQRMKAKSKL